MTHNSAVLALTPAVLGHDVSSARRARDQVGEFLVSHDGHPRVDRQVVDDVLLAVSELVTNVIVHTHGPPMMSVRVDADRTVTVEIVDPNPAVPAVTDERQGRIGGHGLRIVDTLASAWGVQPHGAGGKTVWAVFRNERADPPDAGRR